MISEQKERMVSGLIRQGQLSEREIAQTAGVARGTVRNRKAGYQPPTAGYGRCTCGAWTLLPCLACQVRRRLGIKTD